MKFNPIKDINKRTLQHLDLLRKTKNMTGLQQKIMPKTAGLGLLLADKATKNSKTL